MPTAWFGSLCVRSIRPGLRAIEDEVEASVLPGWPKGEPVADEGLGHVPEAAAEIESAALLHTPDPVGGIVEEHGRKPPGEGARADPVAAVGHGQIERLVRALAVVDLPEAVEGALAGGEIGKDLPVQHVALERAVERGAREYLGPSARDV